MITDAFPMRPASGYRFDEKSNNTNVSYKNLFAMVSASVNLDIWSLT
jgi:hypothetical protein